MAKSPSPSVNLLSLRPLRNVRSEILEDGTTVLIVPKFASGVLSKWLGPLLAKPDMRMKLDAHGSFLWNACDGQTTVEEIAKKMSLKFGEDQESLYERIGQFVRRLDEAECLVINSSTDTVTHQ